MYYVQMESEDQITESGALSLEIVNKVEKEYHKLRELINSLVLKKKTKLQHILNTTHLTSSYVDKGIADPLESLSDIRKQISEVKYLASQRAETVTKIELIQYAQEEIDWLRDSENAEAAIQNERIVKVRTMQKVLPTMLTNLEAELESQADSFIYDGVDVLQTLKTIAKRINATESLRRSLWLCRVLVQGRCKLSLKSYLYYLLNFNPWILPVFDLWSHWE